MVVVISSARVCILALVSLQPVCPKPAMCMHVLLPLTASSAACA